MNLNLAHVLTRSAANGPGERFVVWVQGCDFACPGCWNPDTWAFNRRDLRTVDDLIASICGTHGIEGVTFSGGEPFKQARALAEVARQVRSHGLSVFIFTGYELNELNDASHQELLSLADVIVTGRYVENQRTLSLPWRGSMNQEVHFLTNRYSVVDMDEAVSVEMLLNSDGSLLLTGFPFEV